MERCRRIVRAAAEGIMVIDLEGRILEVNPALARLLERPEDELVGAPVSSLLDDTGRAQFLEHLAGLRSGELKETEEESLFLRPDGTPVWTLVREAFLPGDEGDPELVVLTVADNHSRKQLLDDLRESERQRVEVEELVRLGSWQLGPDGRYRLSEGMYLLYGSVADDIFASGEAFYAAVHPDDVERVRHAVEGASEKGEAFDFQARVRAETGYVWIRGRGITRRSASGEVIWARGSHQDITRARDTDDALQDLVTQNSFMQAVASAANEASTLDEALAMGKDLVLLHDDWQRARAFVPDPDTGRLKRFYLPGDDDQERDDAGTDPALLVREEQTAELAYRLRQGIWDDVDRLTIAFPVIVRDDVIAVVAITSYPPLYRHDMIEAMTAQVAKELARVADRERIARELGEARDRALEASQHKSDFLATMSHEIRTPLNGIVGLTELLTRTHLTDQQRHLLSGVDMSSRALLGIINDILDFSKIEAGRLELEEVDFEVREVVDSSVGVIADSARAKGLDLQVSISPDVPQVAAGDPTRLTQVLTNLCANAVKFTAEGSVVVRATFVPAEGEGRLPGLRVEVTDTGMGVAPDRVRLIFEPFSQADASTTRTFGGTGLGLAICREIVDALGGTIGVESEPGVGSTFWFEVPLLEPRGATMAESIAMAREQLRGLRTLAVDDVATNRAILVEQLAWWEVPCDAVASAEEAWALLADREYDVVILDMAMPEVDGLMLARRIRENSAWNDLRLIMLTSSLPLDASTLDEAGISVCLPKPVSSTVLRDILLSARTPEGPRPVSVAPSRSSRRILVVEDNPVNQVVALGFLDSLGYDADVAVDGQDALDRVEDIRYELILMDLQMPRLDGFAATRALREREHRLALPRTPIAAMTAAAVAGERERAFAAGMDDFLTKPVTSLQLAEVITRWLGEEPATLPAGVDAVAATPHTEDVVDPERLEDLLELAPDGSFVRRLISSFGSRAPELLGAVRSAAADPDALSQATHSLRGVASNVGLLRVTRLAAELEDAAREGVLASPAQLAALSHAVAEGKLELVAWVEGLSASA